MRVDWKIKGRPTPRWVYGYFVVGYPLISAHFQRKGNPEMWVILGIQVALLFLLFRSSHLLPGRGAFLEFDDEQLSFSGGDGAPWRLADVDSVTNQDRLIQIRVYRAGGMGAEFTARAEEVPEEAWEELTELCRRIQTAMPSVGGTDLGEARQRARELDEDPKAGCLWDEIKTSLGR